MAKSEERRIDAFIAFLMNAPIDDEPETPEEAAAVDEAKAAMKRGEVISLEEVKAKYLGQDPNISR